MIACEESQAECEAFRRYGHVAYSCDLQKCKRGGHPEWHIKGDVIPIINGNCKFKTSDNVEHFIVGKWDLIIAHPPCTRLCNSGQRWLYWGDDKYKSQKIAEQQKAIVFFMMFALADCDRIVIENPQGIMSTAYRKPDCVYNPYDFEGETECKKTCLWLKGVEPLQPLITEQPELEWFEWTDSKTGKKKRQPKWFADAWKLPAKERARVRSKTFPGIAKAMAEQWG